MSKKKNRAAAAAAGTKLDPERVAQPSTEERLEQVKNRNDHAAHPEWAPRMNSVREERTKTIFMVVEIVLVMIPVAMVAMVAVSKHGLSQESLREYFAEDPGFLVTFIAACLQPFVAYLLRVVQQRYAVGDAGYTIGNLIGLLCSEILMTSIPGMVGLAVCIWRVWRNTAPHMDAWVSERGVKGVLFDISGALVVLVFAAICAFANMRVNGAA